MIMEYLLYYLLLNLYGSAITWRFFAAAGIPTWKGFVPVYRTYIWTQVADRPWWWTILGSRSKANKTRNISSPRSKSIMK